MWGGKNTPKQYKQDLTLSENAALVLPSTRFYDGGCGPVAPAGVCPAFCGKLQTLSLDQMTDALFHQCEDAAEGAGRRAFSRSCAAGQDGGWA